MSSKPAYILATEFANDNPEWWDLAHEALFGGQAEGVDLQHIVAQAMKAAFQIGRDGKQPPWPKGREPRRFKPRPPDPATEGVVQRILAGAEEPPPATLVRRRRAP